ncbi:EAL domain-containing protein [Candidatus Colwellia aromaticivorans]|uniref:EAL domain-containing protein n=1 Tax=Candidatus Colwellia aromaticivorans TaxID=2267621 RepID=UPI000DF19FAB|nr:EAL domain-containing protein [Candidatus Colwellia aromaticivorans]
MFKNLNSINIKSLLINFVIWLCIATSTTAFSFNELADKKLGATSINSTFIESNNNLLKFSQLSTLDGLSSSNVFGITQDNQGFIWFATEDGLNRFDGNNFVTYRHNANNQHSIADNIIRKIFIDSEKTLWVGTQNGLSRYNNELDNFDNFTTKINDENSLRDNIIWDIYQNKNELIKSNQAKPLLWISTTKGLHTLNVDDDIKKITFQRINIKNYNDRIREIKTIFQDKQQNYWLGGFDNGIHLLSKNLTYLGSLTSQNKYDLTIDAESLFDIKTIDNQYWLATDNGLFIVDDRYQLVSHLTANKIPNSTKQPLLSNYIRAIEQFDENNVWLATHGGLNTVNLLNDQIESYQNNTQSTSLSENWLMDIYRDSNGTMWLASYGGGLNKYSPLTGLFRHGLTTQKGKNYRVGSFAETSGDIIWLSTDKKGLFKVNKNKSIEQVKIQLKENIIQVLADKNNNLWLYTENNQLFNYLPQSKKLVEHNKWQEKANYSYYSKSNQIKMINTELWYINKDARLTFYNTTAQTFVSYIAPDNVTIKEIQKDTKNNLWLISSDNQLIKFNVITKAFQGTKINLPKNYESEQYINLKVSGNWFWLGSDSQGIALINRHNNQMEIFNTGNILKDNHISSIQIDSKENAWLATNTGITAIIPKTKTAVHFDTDFGIFNPEFHKYTSFKAKNGNIFFGSPNGFYQFNPNDVLKISQSITPPLFTHLYVANKKIAIDTNIDNLENASSSFTIKKQLHNIEKVELAYKQSPISFEFISPNTKLPSQLGYKYRLLSLEKDWIDAATNIGINNNRATYTNLSPGDYIFEVQAYDIHQPSNSKTSHLNVLILPPWWLATSMLFVYSLVSLLILTYVIQQYRNKKLYNSQIKESEERLKLSLWGSGDEMWDWNIATGKIFRSNIWGVLEFPQDGTRNSSSEKNSLGKENTNVHQHDIERVKQALDNHFTNKTEHFEATYRVKDKNNSWIWILDRGKIVERDENNNATRMTGTLKDISQIKKAEERLKLFARCIQNISDAVVIYDRQFIAVDVNKAFQRVTGISKTKMVGSSLSFNQYPISFSQNIKKHLLTKGSWHGEVENLRVNGSKYLTDLSIDIIHDENGNISHFVGVFSDITKRKETEAELIKLASSDTLTGLPNRAFFQANQTRLVKKNINHALLVFDLDNFKKINDSMGHQVGDNILCQVAERMLTLSSKKDTVYRLGGDEFSIIIEDTNDIHTITSLAKDILRTIAQPFKLKNQEIVLYSSIGIVLFPEDGLTGHELLKNADTAMYHAKGSGGNKYQFFSDSMNKQAVKRLQVENLIRHGLKEDSFSVYYQPKIEIATGKIAGMEALVRFETPNKDVVSPIVFIPVSEETGQIVHIGEVVLRKACFATKKWVDAGLFDGRVAVNLSAVQFTQANLVAQITDILKESQLPAKHLELEITEGTVMDSPQAAIDTMLQIRSMGIHLSLDDFGTGYSSLAYLKKFPLNTLKIDKAFVDDIEQSEQGRNMVATIVTIAHNLGMDVVAEGVETNQQLSFLAGLRCEQLQGYLYSKPLATEHFQKYLLAHQITSKSTSFNR